MDGWADGWVLCLNYNCCYTKSLRANNVDVVIKIMREEMRKETTVNVKEEGFK